MNRQFPVARACVTIFFGLIGILAGVATSSLSKAEPFKLLNILGLSFDLFGVLLLTYVITANERLKNFIANWGGLVAFTFAGVFFVSYYFGLFIGTAWFGGKDHALFDYWPIVVGSAIASAFFIEDTVLTPKFAFLRNDESRIKFLGGYFVLVGLAIQIYAALLDLSSKV